MTVVSPSVSVIIPTHNRRASLERTLKSLCLQSYPMNDFEVVVVADGCSDDTAEMLESCKMPLAIRIGQQPGKGAAAARNYGAEIASGSLLIFLDDDVEPMPMLIGAHVQAHTDFPGHVVMGPYYPVRNRGADFTSIQVRFWWHEKFEAMQQPGHRYTYQDLLSGNLSMDAKLFAEIGGFDSEIRSAGGEDYEFGFRALKAGIPFSFVPKAAARHHESMNLLSLLKRACQEGYADVRIGRRHPELRPILGFANLGGNRSVKTRIAHSLIFRYPMIGDRLATFCFYALRLLEFIRLRGAWLKIFLRLRRYWYLRGVAREMGSRSALTLFFQGGPEREESCGQEIEIDLSDGLEAAERRLDRERPAGLLIRYRHYIVGRIPPQAGAERLRGAHLRPALRGTSLAGLLLSAIIVDRAAALPPLPTEGAGRESVK